MLALRGGWTGRGLGSRRSGPGGGSAFAFACGRSRSGGRAAAAAPSWGRLRPLAGRSGRGNGRRRRRGGLRRRAAVAPRPPAAPAATRRRGRRRSARRHGVGGRSSRSGGGGGPGLGRPLPGRNPRRLAPHRRSDLAFGAHGAVGRVKVDPPDHDRGSGSGGRRPLLGQGPARVDGVPRVDGAGELPVQPFPLDHRRDGHVHRAQPDRHGQEQRRRDGSSRSAVGFDCQGREVAGHT